MVIVALERPGSPSTDPRLITIGELVFRCGWGDEDALVELYDSAYFFVAAIVRTALRPPRTDRESAEVVVAAFRRIWYRSPGYAPAEHEVLTWLIDHVLESLDPDELLPTRALPAGRQRTRTAG